MRYVSAALERIASFHLDGWRYVIGMRDFLVNFIGVENPEWALPVADECAASVTVGLGQVVDIGPRWG